MVVMTTQMHCSHLQEAKMPLCPKYESPSDETDTFPTGCATLVRLPLKLPVFRNCTLLYTCADLTVSPSRTYLTLSQKLLQRVPGGQPFSPFAF